MSASECLEHKWLSDWSASRKNGSTAAAKLAQSASIDIINCAESQANGGHTTELAHKLRTNEPTVSPPLPPKPAAVTAAGFFLHQNVNIKNGSNIDELMFNKFAVQRTMHTNNNSSHSNHNGDHLAMAPATLPHPQPLTMSNGEFNANGTDALKPLHGAGSGQSSDKSDKLLKDYAINKENINLSTILMGRTSAAAVAYGADDTGLDVPVRLSNGSAAPLTVQQAIASLSTVAGVAIPTVVAAAATASQTPKIIESILFPDAPTTPKVSRKSVCDADIDTPACVTLVKQFQLNGVNLPARIDFEPPAAADPLAPYKPTVSARCTKFGSSNDHQLDIPSAYRLTATAMTRSVESAINLFFAYVRFGVLENARSPTK